MPHELTAQEIDNLTTSLHYCKVQELVEICEQLHLKPQGKKAHLIASITHFIKTGKQLSQEKIPSSSRKQSNQHYPLAPDTLIVYGSFKNDLATRIFLKKLIGNHFHYTAFGIDWIKQRWLDGNPPTYAEFAHFWQQEYVKRQGKQLLEKPEWAYLNFLKNFKEKNPSAPRDKALAAWEESRLQHKNNALALIRKWQEN